MGSEIAVRNEAPRASHAVSVFDDAESFEQAQRMCGALIRSSMVPKDYRLSDDNPEAMSNALVALDMSRRMGLPPMMVMQNMDVIEGRPSWKSSFIIGALNACGLFDPIEFEEEDRGEEEVSFETWGEQRGTRVTKKVKLRNKVVRATAVSRRTGNVLKGPEVSIAMAVAEGWYYRKGSKWQTMSDLMLRYRAAAFFGRLYAPHVLNGFPMADEVHDVEVEYQRVDRVQAGGEGEAGKPKASKLKDAIRSAEKQEQAAETKAKKAQAKKPEPEPDIEDANFDEVPNDGDGDPDEVPFDVPDGDDDDYSPV